jgi:hypothetical protein
MNIQLDSMDGSQVTLQNINQVNVILGRNGAGKSRFLRGLDSGMANAPKEYRVSYVSPERAGNFKRDVNVEANTVNSVNWSSVTRRANQAPGFKSMSHLALRNAERQYLIKLEDNDGRGKSFQRDCLDPINRMLSNLSIVRGEMDFEFITANGEAVTADGLSSGESETIALAAEVLSFLSNIDKHRHNVLLLDEPDVHQHPDLQARFGQYLIDSMNSLEEEEREKVFICIATHSTPLVCSLASSVMTSIGTKEYDCTTVTMDEPGGILRKVGPFFGHPLSMSLSNDPLLILEGEDDVRVWQQAARTSQGGIRLFPVLANSVDQQSELELFADRMLSAIYDTPIAYSLRDGDGKTGSLSKVGCIVRFRLQCYAIENTLLTTECLAQMKINTWEDFKIKTTAWITDNPGHRSITQLNDLLKSENRLRNERIKDIRNIILAITKTKKPWEVIVGQSLADAINSPSQPTDLFGLFAFVGADAAKSLLKAT